MEIIQGPRCSWHTRKKKREKKKREKEKKGQINVILWTFIKSSNCGYFPKLGEFCFWDIFQKMISTF
jgi:hypothetical protein